MFASLFIALAGLASLSGTDAQVSGWHMDTLRVLAVERLDPIVSPNQVASHQHQILGGSAFGAAYNYQDQVKSRCTTASITADKSNYWMPKLYWMNNENSFVPLPARHRFYYFSGRNSPNETVSPFPEGLRMLVGNPNAKSNTGLFSFTCHINSDLQTGSINRDNFNFPRDCPYGIRMESFFPVCWNGRDLYKSDGSHVVYPADPVSNRQGPCPWSHPVRIPQVMLEYTYLPSSWAPGQTVAGNLIWANGDTTGYGIHADFINGWDTDVLGRALNDSQCAGSTISMPIQQCNVLAPYYNSNPSCTPERGVMDETSGPNIDLVPIDSLPGCNPVWGASGAKPGCATAPSSPSVTNWQGSDGSLVAQGSQNKARVLPTTPGWKEVGCIKDSGAMLTGNTVTYYDTALTVKTCTAACSKQGFNWAILGQRNDYRWDCTCGSGIADKAQVYPGMCTSPCPGNSTEKCGAFNIHSVYYAPAGTTVDYNTTGAADPSYMGCYYNTGSSPLGSTAASSYNDDKLTTAGCLQTCANRNATWAATTNGKTCVCGGNDFKLGTGYYTTEASCNFKCTGNTTEACGWTYGYSLYNVTASSYERETYDHPPGWTGCFNDPGMAGLTAYSWTSSNMTPEQCTYGCADLGYSLAGVVMGNRCKCDNTWKGGAKYPYTTCNWPCAGNSSTTCGGNYLSEVYSTENAATLVKADVAKRPVGWKGCFGNSNGAIFRDYYAYDGSLTIDRCVKTCNTYGYTFAGASNQYYCRCTSVDPATVTNKIPSNVYCTAPCPGNKTQTCGAPGQYVDAYSVTDNIAAANETVAEGYVGCYSGTTGLSGTGWTQGDLTMDYCTTGCKELGFALAGASGTRCICGNTWDATKGGRQPDHSCTTPCPGNKDQTCGGYQTTTVFNSSVGATVEAKAQAGYLGCFADNQNNRALKGYSYSSAAMTNALCKTTCSNLKFTLAGTGNGNQCYCGNSFEGGYVYVPSQQCGIACAGNSASQCGGANARLSIFNATVPNTTPTASSAANSTATGGLQSRGCFTDVNTLNANTYTSGYMTVDQCIYHCKGVNATFAGLTAGNQCRCGNSSPVAAAGRSLCNTACVSNSKQTCGGSGVIDVWATSQSTSFVDPYKLSSAGTNGAMGCWQEASGNILNGGSSFTTSTMTPVSCSANCAAQGFTYSATKGNICYCGNSIAFGYTRQADTSCNTACPGDSSATCGGWQVVSIRSAVRSSGTSASASASRSASASAVPSSAAIEGYRGCYAPGTLISSSTIKFAHDTMSTSLCRRMCRVNGFGAAALSGGNTCSCGQTSQLGAKMPDSACTLPCKGQTSEKCGDAFVASIYDTTGAGAVSVPGRPINYVGCFGDTNPRRLPDYSFNSGSMTADLCRRTCQAKGLGVYGTQAGNQCFCGKTIPTSMTFDSNCNYNCAGNSSEACGGSWKLSLYAASFSGAASDPVVPVVSSASSSRAASASASASTSRASSAAAAASSSVSRASSAIASPSVSRAASSAAAVSSAAATSRASSAAASPVASSRSSVAASPSVVSSRAASSAVASPASSSRASVAASPSSSRAASATSTIGAGLAASPSPSVAGTSAAASPAVSSRASSAAASPSASRASSAAASPSAASSRASSAAASPSTAPSASTVQPPAPNPTNHLGCYTQRTPVLDKSVITCDTLTPGMCKLWCNANNYQYAGMTNGTTCGCANEITAMTLVTASTCNKDCFSDTTAKCGGEPGTYNVWKSSGLIARRNHRRRVRMVHGSKKTNEVPMAFNNEEEIVEYLKRQEIY